MKYLSKLRKKNLSHDVCILRVDLNIDPHEALNSPRLYTIIPTIKFLIKRNAKVVILSHRGRPHGKRRPRLSLRPFRRILHAQIKSPVYFFPNFNFHQIERRIERLNCGEVLLLENLRFLPGEEKNDVAFAKQLASLGTMYVNDAFANVHRAHASMDVITRYIPPYVGLWLEEEIVHLSGVLKKPRQPLVVIIGGAKVDTKIALIKVFLEKAKIFLIGGAMANTFLKAVGQDIEDSLYDENFVEYARRMMKTSKMLLPSDTVNGHHQILDIGPKTREVFAREIGKAKTIIWNGPMGYIEHKKFSSGTRAVARAVARSSAFTIVGGGETVELIEKMKISKKFNFVSTGGGAMLEFLSGKRLPGLRALKRRVH